MPDETVTACEVVAIFNASEELEEAIDELLSSGFDRAQLSLLASREAVLEKLDHRYQATSDVADNPAIPRSAFVSSAAIGDAEGGLIGGLIYIGATLAAGIMVVAGGALAATIAAAVLAGGAGGLVGSVLARWVGQHHANYLEEQIENGGLLLSVSAWEAGDVTRATTILRNHAGDNVHAHRALLAAA